MAEPLVWVEQAGPVCGILLNRPEKRNALNGALIAALQEAFERAIDEPQVRVIVLGARGPAFSAGADLEHLQRLRGASNMENWADSRALMRLLKTIYGSPKPVIARVHGPAVAGGCGLVSVCDFVLASPEARFGYTEVRIGFVPALVAVFLLRRIGEAQARRLLLHGGLISAEEAYRIGLVTEVAPSERLDERVRELADELAYRNSASAMALTKRLLADLPGQGLEAALEYAALVNAFARGTPDCQAGVDAFLRGQAPPWSAEKQASGPQGS
ncbi:MAG: enoyl-CoA hydratase-related protein [Bacteroidetes bacterium]|nr:enoyl-CoA hydratase-related protein [Rhodothermia bacterium]MCS7154511.1 enoyl-CoA hydratase-related protein [Bacteroidota bacterium]MCX7906884.1 enoyl-CoA hydratase-related protein [Bacteroidota bacterium]MDW8136837.1 enoyl-CoA hydratase-related protein [Bacteroidota bacterium]MDW8285293.1 enoyl-CoA hydratase-related protein [Bacteroidota bacterium]